MVESNGGSCGTRTRFLLLCNRRLDYFGFATLNGDHGGTRTHLRRIAICYLGFFGIMIVWRLDGGGGI
jgi:hypothetical protein